MGHGAEGIGHSETKFNISIFLPTSRLAVRWLYSWLCAKTKAIGSLTWREGPTYNYYF